MKIATTSTEPNDFPSEREIGGRGFTFARAGGDTAGEPSDDIEAEDDAAATSAEDAPPVPTAIRGRGVSSNRSGRYEPRQIERFVDGWEPSEPTTAPLASGFGAAGRTRLLPLAARKAMSRNDSPDIPFDRAVNPYRGCEHGCVYCFARPDHAYLGDSPGLDFEQRIYVKRGVVAALQTEWASPSYVPETMAIGASTDPYQPAEASEQLTRAVLELALRCRHPVGLVTKSARVVRDLDILTALAELSLVRVFFSITSLDAGLQRRLEPRAAAPAARLQAMRTLADAGVPVGVLAAPMIPAVNDSELEAIVEAAAAAGASSAGWILLRLPREVGPLFDDWLQAHLPDRRQRVLALMRQARGGKLYDATFGVRMRGEGPYAALLAQRFELVRRRCGLDAAPAPLRRDLFVRPAPAGNAARLQRTAAATASGRQLSLL